MCARVSCVCKNRESKTYVHEHLHGTNLPVILGTCLIHIAVLPPTSSIRTHTISNSPTVELKSIASTLLKELNKDEEGDTTANVSFKDQLNQISLIKQRQLSDYLQVCILRLQSTPPEEESDRTRRSAEDHLCILKAILSV